MLKTWEKIKATSSKNSKQTILASCKEPAFKTAMWYAYDPYITYGIIDVTVNKVGKKVLDSALLKAWFKVLDELASRKYTGDAARASCQQFLEKCNEETQSFLLCILKKDMRMGMSEKSINKVWFRHIPTFGCQLAEQAKKCSWSYPIYVDQKLDGLRCIAVKAKGGVSLSSRNGKPLSFPHIELALQEEMPDNTVFDGEVYHKAGFQTLMTQARRETGRNEKLLSQCTYHVFDVIPLKDFQSGVCENEFGYRRELIEDIFDRASFPKCVQLLDSKLVKSEKEMQAFYDTCVADGFEGIMIKNPEGIYQAKRSDDWIKMKPTNDFDCKVTKVIRGTGKYSTMLGAIEVKQENGKLCQVGSGFSDAQRLLFFKNPQKLVGKTAVVRYQELSRDGIMRFPIFIATREDK